jgi:mRNA-degrading endonuclease RelE of RelBE toxin-antitoxin system
MSWKVEFTSKASKMTRKLPVRIQERLNALRKSIELDGPVQASMPHFGKLTGWTKETTMPIRLAQVHLIPRNT